MKITDTHGDGAAFFHDIADPVAYIHATLNRSGIVFSQTEREDLIQEGLMILTRMARAWHSGHEYSQKGKFSGYVSMFLPRRLGDAWHRMHPEHRYVTNKATGRREWQYDLPPVSLDGISSGGGRYHRSSGSPDQDGGGMTGIDHALMRARRIHEFTPIPSRAA